MNRSSTDHKLADWLGQLFHISRPVEEPQTPPRRPRGQLARGLSEAGLISCLSNENPLSDRIQALQILSNYVRESQLFDALGVWAHVKGLLDADLPLQVRRTVLLFLIAFCEGQEVVESVRADIAGVLTRKEYCREELQQRVEILGLLTSGSTDNIIPLSDILCSWLELLPDNQTVDDSKLKSLLDFVLACFSRKVLLSAEKVDILRQVCRIAQTCTAQAQVQICFTFCKQIASVFQWPSQLLHPLLSILAVSINDAASSSAATELAEAIFAHSLGHRATVFLLNELKRPTMDDSDPCLAGYVTLLMVGCKTSTSTRPPITSSLLDALSYVLLNRCFSPDLHTRTVRALAEFAGLFGSSLLSIDWELLFSAFEKLKPAACTDEPVVILLSTMHVLIESNQYQGSLTDYCRLCKRALPLLSQHQRSDLLRFCFSQIVPLESNWESELLDLLNLFVNQEPLPAIQMQALSKFREIVVGTRGLCDLDNLLVSFYSRHLSGPCTDDDVFHVMVLGLVDAMKETEHEPVFRNLLSLVSLDCSDDRQAMWTEELLDAFAYFFPMYPGWKTVRLFDFLLEMLSAVRQPSSRLALLKVLFELGASRMSQLFLGDLGSCLYIHPVDTSMPTFDCGRYLRALLELLKKETNSDVYSYILTHLSIQINIKPLFDTAAPELRLLRAFLCERIHEDNLGQSLDLVLATKTFRADLYLLAFRILTSLLGYRGLLGKAEQIDALVCFESGLTRWTPRVAKVCIHALTVAAFEFSSAMTAVISRLMIRLQQIATNPNLIVHILEFLSVLIRLPELYVNFVDSDYRRVFGIALQYTERYATKETPLECYIANLAYQVIAVWYIRCKSELRRVYVPFILRGLMQSNSTGNRDDRTLVCFDVLARFCVAAPPMYRPGLVSTTPIHEQHWALDNNSLLSLRGFHGNRLELVVRRPTGVWGWTMSLPSALCFPNPILALGSACSLETGSSMSGLENGLNGAPSPKPRNRSHSFAVSRQLEDLDMVRTMSSSPASSGKSSSQRQSSPELSFLSFTFLQLLNLPRANCQALGQLRQEEGLPRALRVFDLIPTLDLHKIGVLYIAEGQKSEVEFLGNQCGSMAYQSFIADLGERVSLKNSRGSFTGGLDTSDECLDGEFTYVWNDEMNQIVFHVATMMPCQPGDTRLSNKKRHIGNDYVAVVYNDNSLQLPTFDFNLFPTQFLHYAIQIVPLDASSFQIAVFVKNTQYELGPLLDPKIVSAGSLPVLVRQLALHYNLFSQVFPNPTEYAFNWTSRLRQLRRITEKFLAQPARDQASKLETEVISLDFTHLLPS